MILIPILVTLGLIWIVAGVVPYIENEVWDMPWNRKLIFVILAGPGVWILFMGHCLICFFKLLLGEET